MTIECLRPPRTPTEIYRASDGLYHRLRKRYWARIQAVHPEVSDWLCCHNWGNDAAKKLMRRFDELAARIHPAMNRAYSRAEHEQNHGDHFRPMWCKYCGGHPA